MQHWIGFGNSRRDVIIASIIFALVLGAFWPAVHNDFVGYDDPDYVTSNRHVQQGVTRETVAWAFSSTEAANWHPLTWLSHALDWQLFGSRPWGHHFTSIFIHAANVALCFLVLTIATNQPWRSFVVALLFGIHPLRVESVAWVAERKDVLSAFFFFLTLMAYARYVKGLKSHWPRQRERGDEVPRDRPKAEDGSSDSMSSKNPESSIQNPVSPPPILSACFRPFYLLSLLFFLLGLMTKPMVVTLPFVLLLLDYWPLSRIEVKNPDSKSKTLVALFLEKVPFLLAAFAVSAITFVVQRKGGAMTPVVVPLLDRLEDVVVSYCRYLGKFILPIDLAAFYPPVEHWSLVAVAGAVLFLGAVTLVAVASRRKHPYLAVGWFWFIGTLVPVIGLVQVGEQSMADRYSYIPSVGLLLMVVWGMSDLLSGWRNHNFVLSTTALGAVASVVLTHQQLRYWKDTEHLFRHALEVTQANYLAYNNLGTTLDQQGRWDEAITQFEQALACRPAYAEAHKNLGAVLEHQGRLDQALQQFQAALSLKPDYAEACIGIGSILTKQGKLDDAMGYYERALTLKPDNADAHFNLALALQQSGRLDQAVVEFNAVLKLEPDSADAHNSLGVALEKQGRPNEAIEQYLDAIRLRPDYARAHFNLGVALSRKGRIDAAIGEYQEALALKPDYGSARTNLAILLQMKRSAQSQHE